MRGQTGHNTRPHTRLSPSFLGMDALMTSQLNESLIRTQVTWIINVIGLSLTCYPGGFVQQTSGQLVQELNVCTVVIDNFLTRQSGARVQIKAVLQYSHIPKPLEETHGLTQFSCRLCANKTDRL